MSLTDLVVMPSGDPFKNDPFFANSGFGRMDSMIHEMRQDMKRAMDMNFSNIGTG